MPKPLADPATLITPAAARARLAAVAGYAAADLLALVPALGSGSGSDPHAAILARDAFTLAGLLTTLRLLAQVQAPGHPPRHHEGQRARAHPLKTPPHRGAPPGGG